MSFTYEHPRPSVTVDSVVLNYNRKKIEILLIERSSDPYKNHWALPGGFLDIDEPLEAGVKRELNEETGLEVKEFVQLGAYGKPDRDPRGRVISLAYLSLIKEGGTTVKAASDALEAQWFNIHELPMPLAFDHKEIIDDALEILRSKIKMALTEHFTFFNLSIEEVKELNILLP
ncbi:MAG: NUDIX hydrolase [Bacteroidota bacterium]|nr:NUDIX hydrolase [Bacteroidota bacterium]